MYISELNEIKLSYYFNKYNGSSATEDIAQKYIETSSGAVLLRVVYCYVQLAPKCIFKVQINRTEKSTGHSVVFML